MQLISKGWKSLKVSSSESTSELSTYRFQKGAFTAVLASSRLDEADAEMQSMSQFYDEHKAMFDSKTMDMLNGMDSSFRKWKKRYAALPRDMRMHILGDPYQKDAGGLLTIAEAEGATKELGWYDELGKLNQHLKRWSRNFSCPEASVVRSLSYR